MSNPDQLLDRGKLTIFFGSCAGVGKTYAMLSTARQLHFQGLDVVVGVVETHGLSETTLLLEGIEKLPLKEIFYCDKILNEFDLDGALARKPALILIDEFAHTNVPGSHYYRRYQDVDKLLSAGIDVYTTINVQHLESLNNIVGQNTGIHVWETVPDHIFDEADEVVLVDLPPNELLQRLREGKVYLPQQAEQAIRNFFRKGNLLALRGLSLRRMVDRVDVEMEMYLRSQSTDSVWQSRDSLLWI